MVFAEKQGIGTILRPDAAKTANAASLRRALSADTSSKMQKLAFETSSTSPPGAGVSHVQGGAATTSVLGPAKNKEEEERPAGRMDIWSSIMFQKENDEDEEGSAPYVHPLVKRSKSALSQISLQMCTENLGSENGSDEFSFSLSLSPPPEGVELDANREPVGQPREDEVVRPVKYKRPLLPTPPPQPRNFPPPLRSHSPQMESHRDNGRLVVEVHPQAKHLRAERRGGRLILSLVSDWRNDAGEETTATKTVEKAAAPEPRVPKPSSTISVTQLVGLRNSMTHLVGLAQSKTTPPWPTRFNEVVIKFPEDAGAAPKLLSAVGPRVARLIPTPATSSPFNDYQYCWRRTKPKEAAVLSSLAQQPPPPLKSNIKNNKLIVAAPPVHQSAPVLMWSDPSNETECLVPLLWGLQGTHNIYLDLGGVRYRNKLVN